MDRGPGAAGMKGGRPTDGSPRVGASLRGAERYDEKFSTGRAAFELTGHIGGDPLAEVTTAGPSGGRRQSGRGDDQREGQDPGKLGKFHVSSFPSGWSFMVT